MDSKEKEIDRIRELGEGTNIEFKRGGKGARNDTFESYCAFLNRDGGELLLGIEDDGTVVGLPPNEVKDIVKNLICVMVIELIIPDNPICSIHRIAICRKLTLRNCLRLAA